MAGIVMRGVCRGRIFEAFSMPLGSASTLLIPPGFAGPSGIPLIDKFAAPASPAIIANEAAGIVGKTMNARAIFDEVMDMKWLQNFGCVKPI